LLYVLSIWAGIDVGDIAMKFKSHFNSETTGGREVSQFQKLCLDPDSSFWIS